MVAPAMRDQQPIYICEMMERLGIEPGAGVMSRLSLSYMLLFIDAKAARCQAAQQSKLAEHGSIMSQHP